MLRIEHLTKTYGEKRAVDDLSLSIAPGEICAFIGHNGAGKTTTIKACCGILPFDAGEIFVDGIDVRARPLEAKARMAYIPDNPDLYEFMTGIQFLNFVADMYGVDAELRARRIREYGDAFELTRNLAQFVSEYSHGMKQKLAIVSALLHEPKLMILDEPFVGLDPKAAFLLKEQMHALCARGGAIFFSTHVLDVAEKLCDRVAIISHGRLIRCGGMDEVRGDESLESVFLELEGERGDA
ncbi:MAG: ABC transporter ATP-binding protein [Oscillospiraceae bacterium]|nr:ABC transporter ATP-binding protein [Oscillospiraceae bacterium]